MTHKVRMAAILVAVALLFGIQPAQAAEPQYSGFLTSYKGFKPGPKGGVDRIWVNPKFKFPADLAKYRVFYIDPITVYLSKDGQRRGIPVAELNGLSIKFRQLLINAIKGKYYVAQSPGPGVLRFVIALTDVEPSMPVLDTITSVVPVARVLSFLKKQVTGKHTFVGSASVEGVIVDGGTNEPLIAFVDKRTGDKGVFGGVKKMEDVHEAFEWWAKRLRKVLDQAHAKAR